MNDDELKCYKEVVILNLKLDWKELTGNRWEGDGEDVEKARATFSEKMVKAEVRRIELDRENGTIDY